MDSQDFWGSYKHTIVDWSTVKSIFVYQGKNLGDILLATPLLSQIRRIAPCSEVVMVTSEVGKRIVDRLPGVSVVGRQRSALGAVRVGLTLRRRSRGNCVFIDLHGSFDSEIVSRVLCANISIQVTGCKFRGIGYFSHVVPGGGLNNRHRIEMNLDVLRRLGVDIDPSLKRVDCASLLKHASTADKIDPLVKEQRYVIIHPTSRWLFKTASPSFWIQLVSLIQNRLDLVVMLTGLDAGREGQFIDCVASATGSINLSGRLSLGELAQVIKQASGYIGVDTFASHIASGLNTPGVVIFGPSNEHSWGPFGDSYLRLVVSENHPCRPCNLDGCGGGKRSECLETLSPERVFNELVEAM